jgi:hypothetical protein
LWNNKLNLWNHSWRDCLMPYKDSGIQKIRLEDSTNTVWVKTRVSTIIVCTKTQKWNFQGIKVALGKCWPAKGLNKAGQKLLSWMEHIPWQPDRNQVHQAREQKPCRMWWYTTASFAAHHGALDTLRILRMTVG